jgi:hypothetical protein
MSATIKVMTHDEEGDELELELPACWIICPRCRGEGKHSNPSIDGNGITASEWAEWDGEEREHYMTGEYDVDCQAGCSDGKRLVPDPDRMTAEQLMDLKNWEEYEREAQREEAEDRRTRMMESGGGWG